MEKTFVDLLDRYLRAKGYEPQAWSGGLIAEADAAIALNEFINTLGGKQ